VRHYGFLLSGLEVVVGGELAGRDGDVYVLRPIGADVVLGAVDVLCRSPSDLGLGSHYHLHSKHRGSS
jgi:hypothetical protein